MNERGVLVWSKGGVFFFLTVRIRRDCQRERGGGGGREQQQQQQQLGCVLCVCVAFGTFVRKTPLDIWSLGFVFKKRLLVEFGNFDHARLTV